MENSSSRSAIAIEQVRRLLSGTSTLANSAEVEEAHALSRSQSFAAGEDIKECQAEILHNAPPALLVEAALRRETGSFLTQTGALSVRSGAKTGRSPKDTRVVAEPTTEDHVWWGPVNIKLSYQSFMTNRERAIDYLNVQDRIYVVDGYAGDDATTGRLAQPPRRGAPALTQTRRRRPSGSGSAGRRRARRVSASRAR